MISSSCSRREVAVTLLDLRLLLLLLLLISSRPEARVLRRSWSVGTVFCTVGYMYVWSVYLCICLSVYLRGRCCRVFNSFFERIDRVVLGSSLFLLRTAGETQFGTYES